MGRYRFSADPEEYFRGFALPLFVDSFTFCATVGAIGLIVPHAPEVRSTAGWILVGIAYLGATVIHIGKHHFPMRFRQLLALPAVAVILAAVWVGGPGTGAISLGAFTNLLAVGILAAFELRWTVAYLVLIAVGYASILAFQHVEGWQSLTVILIGELVAVVFIAHALISRLRTVALQDELTGLENRRAWYGRLREEISRGQRTGSLLTVILIDLDGFKDVNDRFGHDAGDRLLVEISSAWLRVLRPGDTLARWGGDEFSLILTDCKDDCIDEVVNRLKRAMPPPHAFSHGTATWDGFESIDELMRRADFELYAMKQSRDLTEE